MYRLPCTLSIAFVLGVSSFAAAQEPKTDLSLLKAAPATDKVVAEKPELEFIFLEELRPANRAFAPKFGPNLEAGFGSIDFDQVFSVLPDDKPSVGQPALVPEVAVPPEPVAPIVVAQMPTPPAPVGAAPAAPAPAMEAAPAMGAGVQPAVAIEEIDSGIAFEEVVVLPSDEAVPPLLAEGNCGEPITMCDTCNNTTPCKCRSKGSKWTCLEDWWHNTCLYRNHMQNKGQPGMFCERPFGVCNEGFAGAMIAAGKADRAMLHHYDFVHHAGGGVELTQRGHRELGRIAGIMAEFPVPLSIESTLNPAEDAGRRNAVVDAIARLGLPISSDSVLVSGDRTIGLSGIDAEAVHAIRTSEAATGASRTQPYRDASGATQIPFISGNAGGKSR